MQDAEEAIPSCAATARGLSHQALSAMSFTPESAFLQENLACPIVSSSVKHVDGGEDVVG